MDYFANVKPITQTNEHKQSLPPPPTVTEINEMVRRVEARAYAMLKHDDFNELIEQVSFDCYYMMSPEDSDLWWVLCTKAKHIGENDELAHILWYIRGCGTKLVKHPRWGYILEPVIQRGGWESREHWERDKHILDKYCEEVVKLLKELSYNQ